MEDACPVVPEAHGSREKGCAMKRTISFVRLTRCFAFLVVLPSPLVSGLFLVPDARTTATPTPTATPTITVLIDFEGLGNNEAVSNFYNGGTGGNRSGPGPNLIAPAIPGR